MRYLYEVYNQFGVRIDITTKVNDFINIAEVFAKEGSIRVFDLLKSSSDINCILHSQDDLDGWIESLERAAAWTSVEDRVKALPPLEVSTINPEWNIVSQEFEKHEAHPKWDPFKDVEITMKNTETGFRAEVVDTTKVNDAINPSHYQAYMDLGGNIVHELQWLEAMQYLPRYRDPEKFKAAVELLARKYIDRLGGKDESAQEVKKAIWYFKFLAAYIANGNRPIRVEEVDKLLGKI